MAYNAKLQHFRDSGNSVFRFKGLNIVIDNKCTCAKMEINLDENAAGVHEFISREINIIGQTFIVHPNKMFPSDICPRDELICPKKIRAALNICIAQNAWTDTIINDASFRYISIPIDYNDHNINFAHVSPLAFYIICEDPTIFEDLITCSENDIEAFLHKWARKPIIFSSSILLYEGRRGLPVYYTVPNTFPSRAVWISPVEDICNQLITNDAFTIANGITLAIAMHRLGNWSGNCFARALQNHFSRLDDIDAFTEITDGIMDLYMTHTTPHIADFPNIYAALGADSVDKNVLQILTRVFNPTNMPFVQYYNIHDNTAYVTSERIAQNLPPISGFSYRNVPDVLILFESIAQSRSMYRWYVKEGERIFRNIDHLGSQKRSIIVIILKRLCHAYNLQPSRRLRRVWNDLTTWFNIDATRWIMEQHVMKLTSKNTAFNRTWVPWMPITFIKDIIRKCPSGYLHKKRSYGIISSRSHTIRRVFNEFIIDGTPNNAIGVKLSLMDMFKLCPRNSPPGIMFHKFNKNKIARLMALRTITNQAGGSAVWEPLRSLFESNRDLLIL